MTVLTITHGDDVDGLICGAFLKRLKNSEVFLANYDNLEIALGKVQQPVDTLYLCDLNIRASLEPLLNDINEFAEIFIIDHHQMDQAFMDNLVTSGVNVKLCISDCAGVLPCL
jgi:oligoribonuclease NrnB/cAMP/cGMP phosphodiesterase (DHH superfamily)